MRFSQAHTQMHIQAGRKTYIGQSKDRALTSAAGLPHPPHFSRHIRREDGIAVIQCIIALVIAFMATAATVVAHNLSPLLSVFIALAIGFSCAIKVPLLAMTLIFVSTIFQNFFVSLVSPWIDSTTSFNIARGYNFLILCAVFAVVTAGYFQQHRGRNPQLDKVVNFVLLAFGIIGFYFLIGVVTATPMNAVIYVRNTASGLMMFTVAILLFSRYPIRLTPVLIGMAMIVVMLGFIELFYREYWLAWTNGYAFWDWSRYKSILALEWDKAAQKRGQVTLGIIDSFKVTLFNTPLLSGFKLDVIRAYGPNMHAISYAYVIAFFMLIAGCQARYILLLLLFPLMIAANAKGALILVILVFCAWVAFRLFGIRFAFFSLAIVLTVYALAGIVVGLNIGDYHVLGLMGGFHNFIENPFGRGLGNGGNLAISFIKLDWEAFQAAGRTPVAMESAIAVMLYQMGVGAIVILGIYIWLAWQNVQVALRTGEALHAVASFSLLTVLVNGLFQEEALFSPLSLGLILSLNGMVLGAALRNRVLNDGMQ